MSLWSAQNFWRNRLNADPQVLGRSITLNGVPTTIVGVLPNLPVAWFGRDLEVVTAKPFELPGLTQERLMRGVSFLRVVGRLKPGVTIEQARAALPALQQSYREAASRKRRQLLVARRHSRRRRRDR